MSSARYAYANTPDNDSKLRAHYLALIIRSRSTFKRSGTMQMEMEAGGKLFFDLFVAMCNHMVRETYTSVLLVLLLTLALIRMTLLPRNLPSLLLSPAKQLHQLKAVAHVPQLVLTPDMGSAKAQPDNTLLFLSIVLPHLYPYRPFLLHSD